MQKITKTQCPNCGTESESAIPMDNPKDVVVHGSLCFCGECGNINKFNKELQLEEVTEDDMMLIKGISETEYYEILQISATINQNKQDEKDKALV